MKRGYQTHTPKPNHLYHQHFQHLEQSSYKMKAVPCSIVVSLGSSVVSLGYTEPRWTNNYSKECLEKVSSDPSNPQDHDRTLDVEYARAEDTTWCKIFWPHILPAENIYTLLERCSLVFGLVFKSPVFDLVGLCCC